MVADYLLEILLLPLNILTRIFAVVFTILFGI